jgi:hypothetical protein
MSQWEKYHFEERIRGILQGFQYTGDDLTHFGQPFVSAYQIAIAYAERHPEAFNEINLPIGGRGTSESNSLTQYIARELSGRIKNGEITDIEPAWFRRDYVEQLDFKYENRTISATNPAALSMFRLHSD